ncbi:MAG: phosphotransferase [Austwickia sp.]|nr:MAG: phosphotransferase [Austwickia sp.]
MTPDVPYLAALACGAVAGLRPVRAQLVRDRPGDRFAVAFVADSEGRPWVVRLPADAVAAAQQDASVALLDLLARRVPFAVPAPKGHAALKDGRRAMVYPYIDGQPLRFAAIPPGPGLASELGRAIASLHNVDRRLFDEASMPAYSAEDCRRRHLVDLDRAAATGLVPVGLLARWERQLDDVSRWRFAPTPIHGRLDGPQVLAAFSDDADAASGRVRGLLGWENAQVGDPAQDLARLLAEAGPQTADTVLEAYTMTRVEQPDPHLEWRARLTAELRLGGELLVAVSGRERPAVAAAVHALRQLDEQVGDPDTPPAPVRPDPAVDVVPAGPPRGDQLYQSGARPAEPSRPEPAAQPEEPSWPESTTRPVEPSQPEQPSRSGEPSRPDRPPPVASTGAVRFDDEDDEASPGGA